ncbi:MAG: glutamyl-tRNA reductase [Thermomicrobiales bacterium]|nr:glutamyl-tRNA reductase [Thermomicrobiales bacterium]MCO5224116.1 glutamyl-tRNA reductase [Thermomicrobiales bacterium]MCO5226951.1 glutamyl-tRNA reductase [Thermomicrobiales bacterium]
MTGKTPTIVVVGSNHEYAPVEIRERLAFSGEELARGLESLRAEVPEGMILSTCNRTEVYAVGTDGDDVEGEIFRWLHQYHSVPVEMLERSSYVHRDRDAVNHIFRVASGLDSMVLGEPQILSQLRDALDSAREREAVGPMLQRLAQDALTVGKKARTRTDIARNNVSIAHAAVELAKLELGSFVHVNVTILGAGKMASLAAKLLRAQGCERIFVVNRTLENAQELAVTIEGDALPMESLPDAIMASTLVIGAAMADEPILRPEHVRERDHRLWCIDVSVPRVISQDVGQLPFVSVRDVDALEPIHNGYRQRYASEVHKVEELVQSAAESFEHWIESRQGIVAINSVRQRGDEIREAELSKALRKLGHLSERDQNVVRAMAVGLVNKMLHQPIQELRNITDPAERATVLRALGLHETDIS